MRFGDWIEQARELGKSPAAIDAMCVVYDRALTARMIVSEVLGVPHAGAIAEAMGQIERAEALESRNGERSL